MKPMVELAFFVMFDICVLYLRSKKLKEEELDLLIKTIDQEKKDV
jgi:hypothetical protein